MSNTMSGMFEDLSIEPIADDLRPAHELTNLRAHPISFSGCAGWLYPSVGGHGVILCGPVGQEALAVHRGWRGFALQLAQEGMTALQFDYPGTGDSVGDETDPDRLQHWVDSVVAAAELLRSHHGAIRISLVGLRIGAAIAALAAPLIGDVHRLVCLNPVVSGRNHVRELRLLANTWWTQAAPDQRPLETPAGCLDVIGYRWTAPSLKALEALDLRRLDDWPRRVVLMDSTHRPEVTALAELLRSRNIAVSELDFPGAAAFLQDALLAVPPQAAFDEVAAMLADPTLAAGRRPHSTVRCDIKLPGAVEIPLAFGAGGVLHAVLCRPTTPDSGHSRRVVLMLNTGFTHHVGHAQLNVLLARALAAAGVASLRMDAAGIGDSDVPPGQTGALLHDTRAGQDVSAAIDALERLGLSEITVLGLCTGGFQAFHAAVADPRIKAIIPINTQKFIWVGGPSFNVSYDGNRRATGIYLRASLHWRNWMRAGRGEVDVPRIAGDLLKRGAKMLRHKLLQRFEDISGRELRPGQMPRWIAALSARGVRMRFIYSSADPGLADLCFEISPARVMRLCPGFTVEILPRADHTLSSIAARDELIRRVLADFDVTD